MTAEPGDVIVYTLDYANTSDVDATGVTLLETLPENTRFDEENSDPGWVDQGDGTFAVAASYPAGDFARFVAVGDFDGVNGPDLAVVSQSSADVSVLLNQGDGTFAAAASYPAGDIPRSVPSATSTGSTAPTSPW